LIFKGFFISSYLALKKTPARMFDPLKGKRLNSFGIMIPEF
jgi:hypothetical protein